MYIVYYTFVRFGLTSLFSHKDSFPWKSSVKLELSIFQETKPSVTEQKRHLDFLDILLTARDEHGHGLSPQEIQDEVDTFTFEGISTFHRVADAPLTLHFMYTEW